MELSSQSQLLIEQTLQTALKAFSRGSEQSVVTDIHIQPRCDSGELTIYNDDDEELARAVIEEWAENQYTEDAFYAEVEPLLRDKLLALRDSGALDKLSLLKPYSFVLVDDEKETIADLLLMDDNTMMLDDELLKGLDKELDDFLEKLLEE